MADVPSKAEDEKILAEAKSRFEKCDSYESEFRSRFVDDLKFGNADSENGWQWDSDIKNTRDNDSKPCLTINKTRQHCLQIINDGKQNKPGVNIRPVGDGASYDAAQVLEGIIRHIEYQSNAEQAYDTAQGFQVYGGIGYWRVVTDYVSDDSFDQEIYIRRIKDPRCVFLDPDIEEIDGADAKFGFIWSDMDADEFKKAYPDEAEKVGKSALGVDSTWSGSDKVRIAEYYRKTQKQDKLLAFTVPMPFAEAGTQIIVRKSQMDDGQKAIYALVEDAQGTTSRDIVTDEVMWYKIVGDTIVDRREWPGKYIPIVRIVGEELIIDGKLDRKGHVRAMKDAQRMYNYWSSEATAQVALQTKTPYVAPAEAIAGFEKYWQTANTENYSVLPYNAIGEQGEVIPPPKREQPPQMAAAYVQGMQIAQNELMMSSGQYQSQFGQNENATSGVAINERQRQGDTATYHYIDGLAIGIRYTGVILIDLIPKVYDTERVIRILAQDGKQSEVQIKPDAPAAFEKTGAAPSAQQGDDVSRIVQVIFNPNVGRYLVESDIGPGFATRRQEAFNAMTQIAAQNPQFMGVAGDLMWKSADFPMADELAERWSRIIPKNITGEAPAPEVQQMQQTIQQLQETIANLNKQLHDKQVDQNIKGYDATTKRLTAVGNSGPAVSPDQIEPAVRQLLMQMLQNADPEGDQPQMGMGEPMGQPAQPPMSPEQQPPQGMM